MVSVDFRTRFEADAVPLDPAAFVEIAGALPSSRAVLAGRGARRLGLTSLTLDVQGEPVTFAVGGDDQLVVRLGGNGDVVVGLDGTGFSDLVQDVTSTFWLN